MSKHPLTLEKEYLKDLASQIIDLKLKIRTGSISKLPCLAPVIICYRPPRVLSTWQRDLARLKSDYRHRHMAYCLTRHSIANRFDKNINGQIPSYGSVFRKGPIISCRSKCKMNYRRINVHRGILLTAIAKFQSNQIDNLIKENNGLKPCIAIFKPEFGEEKKLRIKDFTPCTNGDFIWDCKKNGTIYNDHSEWFAHAGDIVTLDRKEYNKMPDDLKMPHKNPMDPVHQDATDFMMDFEF